MLLQQQGDWRGVAFDARLPAQPVELVCDGPKLSQALTNLLQNAAQRHERRATAAPAPSPSPCARRRAAW